MIVPSFGKGALSGTVPFHEMLPLFSYTILWGGPGAAQGGSGGRVRGGGGGAVPPYEFMWVLVMVAKHHANISVYF